MRNGRCRDHGGASTGAPGNKNALKHGAYARGIRADEAERWFAFKPGSVEDELRLLRLQTERTAYEQARRKRRSPGLDQLFLQQMGRISHLELTRKALAVDGSGDGTPQDTARRVQEALAAMIATAPKEPG
jgi:hypothetical protein